ncbi:MAG: cyclohydrolase [Myxococcaceae bacterium]|nr:cyclohydrolase [Myxococcaceae bacterium]
MSPMCALDKAALAGVVSRYADAVIPTDYGRMRVVVYHEAGTPHEHCAIIHGDVQSKEHVLIRVHSECFTGEVLHSLKCDCREQLDYALRAIAKEDAGIVIYLRQEGRGIGLGNKIRAYALQDERGADTVDANRLLGFADDLRRYHVATCILAELDITSVRLLTNNPLKVDALRAEGLEVERVPMQIEPGEQNEGYISTKRTRMGHLP